MILVLEKWLRCCLWISLLVFGSIFNIHKLAKSVLFDQTANTLVEFHLSENDIVPNSPRGASESLYSKFPCLNLVYLIQTEDWIGLQKEISTQRCLTANRFIHGRDYVQSILRGQRLTEDELYSEALQSYWDALGQGGMHRSMRLAPLILAVQQAINPEITWPDLPTARFFTNPTYLIGQAGEDNSWEIDPIDIGAGTRLIGFEYHQQDFETGLPIRARFWWLTPTGERVEDTFLVNMVYNGSLEWESPEAGLFPNAFRDDFYQFTQTRSVVTTIKNHSITHGAQLGLDPDGRTAVLISKPFRVFSDCIYLFGAWVRSNGATTIITIDGASRFDRNEQLNYVNIFEGKMQTDWIYFATLVRPIPGVKSMRIIVTNLHSQGDLVIDDLLVAPVGNPGSRCVMANIQCMNHTCAYDH